jgi:PAS domain S-box-containing protein
MVEGKPVGYVCMYKDIGQMKRYEKCLSALNAYGRKLNTAVSMEEIYSLTLEAAQETLGFEFADILMVGDKVLQLVAYRGPTKFSSLTLPLDGNKGVTVQAVRTGRPVFVSDVSKEEAYVEGEEGARSELAVPIKIGSRVIGVLNVESRKADAFNEKDKDLLEILSSHAATATSNLEYARDLEAYAKEVRESKQKFEQLFTDNPEAAVHLDTEFHILNVNPRFMRLFGYSLDEIKSRHIDDTIVPEDKMEEAARFDERASKGKIYHEDTVRKRKDGNLVPVAFSVASLVSENKVSGYIAVYKDISQLKKGEERLREALEKLEKINEKLRVVGGLTRHDARNKLSVIGCNIYLARKKLPVDSEVLNYLKEMDAAAAQMIRIFDFAKTYEMLGVEELRYINVKQMVEEAVSLFSDLKGVQLIKNCDGLSVLADSLLRQLFYDLIDNSLKYGEKTTTITVRYEKTDQDKLKLIYEDDGVGIAKAERKKLFQEGQGRGTGYGLYLIKKMCEGYGWVIEETGKEGKGAQFTMTMPKVGENGKTSYKIS